MTASVRKQDENTGEIMKNASQHNTCTISVQSPFFKLQTDNVPAKDDVN